jgi:hypothetical protein
VAVPRVDIVTDTPEAAVRVDVFPTAGVVDTRPVSALGFEAPLVTELEPLTVSALNVGGAVYTYDNGGDLIDYDDSNSYYNNFEVIFDRTTPHVDVIL